MLCPFQQQDSSGTWILYFKNTSLETFQKHPQNFITLWNSGRLLCGCQEVARSNSQTRIEKLHCNFIHQSWWRRCWQNVVMIKMVYKLIAIIFLQIQKEEWDRKIKLNFTLIFAEKRSFQNRNLMIIKQMIVNSLNLIFVLGWWLWWWRIFPGLETVTKEIY